MIDIIIKQNTIGGLFLTDNSILLAPLFETTSCAIQYFRGIPGNRAVRKKRKLRKMRRKKKKEGGKYLWRNQFFGSLIEFEITENHELCVVVVDDDEGMLYPLDYVRVVKILS